MKSGAAAGSSTNRHTNITTRKNQMPIYGYKCEKCDHVEDYLVKSSDPVPACKNCGSTEQEKEISSGAFLLMGYGWSKNGMNSRKVGKR